MAEEETLEERKKRLTESFKSNSSENNSPKIEQKNDNVIEIRKDKALNTINNIFKKGPELIYYSLLLVIIWIGLFIRTRNLPLIREGFLPADPDSALFLRYMQTIVEKGSLPIMDNMRYLPLGFNTLEESRFLAQFLAKLYGVISSFNPDISIIRVDMLYPLIIFPFTIIAFFFLVKKIFDWRVGVIASAFLAVIPAFLQRTMLGFSDKEPLGMFFFFVAFYFLVSAWKENKLSHSVMYGLLAGAFTGLLALVWGAVTFAFMIIGTTYLAMIFFGSYKKKDFAVYLSWLLPTVIISILGSARFSIEGFITSPTSALAFLPLLVFIVLFTIGNKINIKFLPKNVSSIIISLVLGLVLLTFIKGTGFLGNLFSDIILSLLHPFGVIRLTLTVAENQQPFISTWLGTYGRFFWIALLGVFTLSTMLFSNFKKKYKYRLIGASVIFIVTLIFTRYSGDSIFNGTNTISQLTFFGGMLFFAGYLIYTYIYSYNKDKETFEDFLKIDKILLFALIWFSWLAIGARGAIRLLFLFTPVIAIFGSLFFIKVIDLSSKFKDKFIKIGVIVLVLIMTLTMFLGFERPAVAQTSGSFPNLHPQWMGAMDWVKENTAEDAVFAHWWDYGYWVQTGGERATVLDGGNALPYWNFMIARYVLTGSDDKEALEYLYAHNVTHLLIDPSDIGKYPAYSQIGSDANYDRYSWIHQFSLGQQSIQETRDGTIYFFQGGTVIDQDFEWEGQLFVAERDGIAGFILPTSQQDGNIILSAPTGIFIKDGQRVDIPITCTYFNGQVSNFDVEGLDGCLHIIPQISQQGQFLGFGNAFYVSPKVKQGFMARLYLQNEDHPNFNLVYSESNPEVLDVQGVGRVAPIKIWEVIYPEDIEFNPKYLEKEFPSTDIAFARGYQ